MVQGTAAGLSSVDGFVTNTANTTPLNEPNLPNPELSVNGQPIKSAKYYEWNPYFDETDFTQALYSGFVGAGWPGTIGFIIDTGRNGWGGPNRPTAAVGSDITTYVNSGPSIAGSIVAIGAIRATQGSVCRPLQRPVRIWMPTHG